MTGWNLPPGCTDKDIDDAAPPSYPDCCFCGKPIECPDEPEDYHGDPCHGPCKENYVFDLKYGGPEYEPE